MYDKELRIKYEINIRKSRLYMYITPFLHLANGRNVVHPPPTLRESKSFHIALINSPLKEMIYYHVLRWKVEIVLVQESKGPSDIDR